MTDSPEAGGKGEGVEELVARLRKQKFSCWYRNPDGPEAADLIERLASEKVALEVEKAAVMQLLHDVGEARVTAEQSARGAEEALEKANMQLNVLRKALFGAPTLQTTASSGPNTPPKFRAMGPKPENEKK